VKFYLAGPVGYGNPGREWKHDLVTLIRDAGHTVYDPIENDDKYPLVETMNQLKKSPRENCAKIKEIMQEIFIDDCEFITGSDYIICYFAGRALGTSSEQGIAYYLNRFMGKRIKTICIFDKEFMPDEWTLCCSDYTFFSLDECKEFLKELI
jgi:hypothetical protein